MSFAYGTEAVALTSRSGQKSSQRSFDPSAGSPAPSPCPTPHPTPEGPYFQSLRLNSHTSPHPQLGLEPCQTRPPSQGRGPPLLSSAGRAAAHGAEKRLPQTPHPSSMLQGKAGAQVNFEKGWAGGHPFRTWEKGRVLSEVLQATPCFPVWVRQPRAASSQAGQSPDSVLPRTLHLAMLYSCSCC